MPRIQHDLGGEEWLVGQAPLHADPYQATWRELANVTEWLPAAVPGNVRADLFRAQRIRDPYYGTQADDSQWVEGRCWWYVRDFPHLAPDVERIHLVLRGVDYVWDLFLNGHHLGRHEGMFSPRTFDITRLLQAENRLAVRIVGSDWLPHDRSRRWERLLNRAEAFLGKLAERYPQRRDTLKCQMGFGWDFAPPVRTMGIWDSVDVIATGRVFIGDILTTQELGDNVAAITCRVELRGTQPQRVKLRLTLSSGEGNPVQHVDEQVLVDQATSYHTLQTAIAQPRLWWPWDHGQPYLYRLRIEVWHEDELVDELEQPLGIRQVELRDWQLHVNGKRVFARGANWVPADILPGRLSRSDYQHLLSLARDANMNMLRVWAGGLREKRAFYDQCDQMGILVWQDLPFACAVLSRFPRSREYLRLVDREVRGIVRELRMHPSVVLWCGGNEFDPERNKPLVFTIDRAVAEEDATRPFIPVSPATGDRHNWSVWHAFAAPSEYLQDESLFASEFGMQSPPELEHLRSFIPPSELWPPGPAWTYHGAQLDKLHRYARPFLPAGDFGPDDFIHASREAQANGLQIAVEHFRRRKAQGCGGVLVWQFNEPWPAISWALVDYTRQCKPAYHRVGQLYSPQLVSLHYDHRRYQQGDRFCPDVWVINDASAGFPASQLEVSLWNCDGVLAEQFHCTVDVDPESAQIAAGVCWSLPVGGGWRLTCRLTHEGNVLTENRYDLAVFDGDGPNASQRLRRWLAGLVRTT